MRIDKPMGLANESRCTRGPHWRDVLALNVHCRLQTDSKAGVTTLQAILREDVCRFHG